MKSLPILTIAIVALLGSSCRLFSDRKTENPGVVSTFDLHEAQYLSDLLNLDPRNRGMFEVTPGSSVTTVTFKQPEAPLDEAELRESMREIKDDLSRQRGKTANTLRFVFPRATIEE